MPKEFVSHCNQEQSRDLQEKITSLMISLGLRIKAIPSTSKQYIMWQACNPDGSLALTYTRKYEYGKYVLQVDVHKLEQDKTNRFYEELKQA